MKRFADAISYETVEGDDNRGTCFVVVVNNEKELNIVAESINQAPASFENEYDAREFPSVIGAMDLIDGSGSIEVDTTYEYYMSLDFVKYIEPVQLTFREFERTVLNDIEAMDQNSLYKSLGMES